MNDDDLDAIEARAKDAPTGSRCVCSWQMAQARHIAHTRDNVTALVDEVRKLRDELDRLRVERENVRAVAAQPGRTPNGHRWT